MHHEIDRFSDLGFGVGKGRLSVAAHDKIGKAAKGLFGGVRMDGSERSGMASVEGIEQRSCFNSAHFAKNDPVGTESESVFQKSLE